MRRIVPAVLAALLLAPACSGDSHTVTVLAAASLTDAFQTIGRNFESANPGVTVRFSFGPSDGLAQQIRNGAPADVFASAGVHWMDVLARNPGVGERADFARNRLTVVVPSSNPAGIRRLADLAKPGVKLVLAAPGVPAGDYARMVLRKAGIADPALHNLVSNEVDVEGVVAKVASGDADGGIVYVTDVPSNASAIPIPQTDNVTATYPIAVLRRTKDPTLGAEFVQYVLGPGRSVLRRDGFLPP